MYYEIDVIVTVCNRNITPYVLTLAYTQSHCVHLTRLNILLANTRTHYLLQTHHLPFHSALPHPTPLGTSTLDTTTTVSWRKTNNEFGKVIRWDRRASPTIILSLPLVCEIVKVNSYLHNIFTVLQHSVRFILRLLVVQVG